MQDTDLKIHLHTKTSYEMCYGHLNIMNGVVLSAIVLVNQHKCLLQCLNGKLKIRFCTATYYYSQLFAPMKLLFNQSPGKITDHIANQILGKK